MPIPRALGEKGKKRHLWMRRKEREGHRGFLREGLHPATWHPATKRKEPGRSWKRKLVGWHKHFSWTTVLIGGVVGVKGNGNVYTFPSGREQADINPDRLETRRAVS